MEAPRRWDKITWLLNSLAMELVARAGVRHPIRPAEESWESLTLFLFQDERSSREEVERAVRHVAKAMRPPDEISPKATFYFCYRIQCAHDFLGMLFPPESKRTPICEVPSSWSDGQLIEWLLIDLWQRRHDHWMKLNAIGIYGPFGFYGVGEADPSKPQ